MKTWTDGLKWRSWPEGFLQRGQIRRVQSLRNEKRVNPIILATSHINTSTPILAFVILILNICDTIYDIPVQCFHSNITGWLNAIWCPYLLTSACSVLKVAPNASSVAYFLIRLGNNYSTTRRLSESSEFITRWSADPSIGIQRNETGREDVTATYPAKTTPFIANRQAVQSQKWHTLPSRDANVSNLVIFNTPKCVVN